MAIIGRVMAIIGSVMAIIGSVVANVGSIIGNVDSASLYSNKVMPARSRVVKNGR